MTLNYIWGRGSSYGDLCRVPLYCHYSLVYYELEWLYLWGSHLSEIDQLKNDLYLIGLFNSKLFVLRIVTWNYYMYIGGACGVVVISIGNKHSDMCSNPGRVCLHFTKCFGEVWIQIYSFQLWVNSRVDWAL